MDTLTKIAQGAVKKLLNPDRFIESITVIKCNKEEELRYNCTHYLKIIVNQKKIGHSGTMCYYFLKEREVKKLQLV